VAAAGLAGLVLATRDSVQDAAFHDGTLYATTSWVFIGALLVCGLAMLAGSWRLAVPVAAAAVVGFVAAVQLAGTGVVAWKHWPLYAGMTGGGSNLAELRALAVVLAVSGLVAAAACAWTVLSAGLLPVPSRAIVRVGCAAGSVALVVGLPLALGAGDPQNQDANSLGAYALIYALPWGGAVLAAGWVEPRLRLAGLLAVLASIVVVASGSQMADIVFSSPTRAFVLAAVVVLAVLAVDLGTASRPRSRH